MKIAVIGAGITGMACAWSLERQAKAQGMPLHVTLFEANNYFGGHSNTVDVTLDTPQGPVTHGVDTGFLVFNPRTYPHLVELFKTLDVPIAPAEMSFAVSLPESGLEWAGTNLDSVFAQRRNLLRPRFLRMLADIMRFNTLTTDIASRNAERELAEPLGAFLTRHKFSEAFRDDYFLPMAGCIWSCPTEQMLAFPVSNMIRFCHNHGLLQVNDRPQWYTVAGGSREYVKRLLAQVSDARQEAVLSVRRAAAGVNLTTAQGTQHFDQVVFASHSDQSLALLHDASEAERKVLSAVRYQPNRAVLHTDASLLPKSRKCWAAWNYSRLSNSQGGDDVCVHYLLNKLQPLPAAWQDQPVIVSLNPVMEPDPALVIRTLQYSHPVFDTAAAAAQAALPNLQGQQNTWFAGAWTGYGFHEDGLRSGLQVATQLMAQLTQADQPVAQAA